MTSNIPGENRETIALDVYHMLPFNMPTDPGVGNPAAVVIVDPHTPISKQTMAYVAKALAQPETIFAKKRDPGIWEVRWYTAGGNEINPGGNSTVALASLLVYELDSELDLIQIKSQFSWLDSSAKIVDAGMVQVTFPSVPPTLLQTTQQLLQSFDFKPTAFYAGQRDLIALFSDESELRSFKPNYEALSELRYFAVIAAAACRGARFGYRTFITTQGEVFEDTGAAGPLMNLASLFHPILGQPGLMHADQVSDLGGEAFCELVEDELRVSAFCRKFSGPNKFTFPLMGGELLCTNQSCSDQFVWI